MHILQLSEQRIDALDLLFGIHRRPFLMQASAGRTVRDDVLAADLIGRIITPVQDMRNGNAGLLSN